MHVEANRHRDWSDGQTAKDDMAEGEDIKKEGLDYKRKIDKYKDQEEESDNNLEQLRYLRIRIADLKEALMCSMCMAYHRNIAFLCSYSLCEHCTSLLKNSQTVVRLQAKGSICILL